MLEQIEIKGFKSIKQLDLKLNNLNILIGANGAGKTNFMLLFKLLNYMLSNKLQLFIGQHGGANALLHFGQKQTDKLLISLLFGNMPQANQYQAEFVPARGGTLVFSQENCIYYGFEDFPQGWQVELGSGHKETNFIEEIKKERAKIAVQTYNDLQECGVYHFHDTSQGAAVKNQGRINDNLFLKPDASNLAAFLYFLQKNHVDYYNRIVETIQLVAPFFEDFILRPIADNSQYIQLEWQEKGCDIPFIADDLSDGTLRFICLATLLLQPKPPMTILIDEPELGLHPYAITLLAALLSKVAIKRQVIVSTQSVTLVNQFSPEDIIVVEREKGSSVFKRLSIKEVELWLDEYSLGELWEKNVLGGRPKDNG